MASVYATGNANRNALNSGRFGALAPRFGLRRKAMEVTHDGCECTQFERALRVVVVVAWQTRARLVGAWLARGAALDRHRWHTVDETTGELLMMMRAFGLPAFIVGFVIVLL
ncbi:MAG: hypothetical protein AAFR70_15320 [Pseudomonadota bacterium]